MNQIGRKYSWFDPRLGSSDCLDCTPDYCDFVHCAIYDADGDRIVSVIASGVSDKDGEYYSTIQKYYKKENSDQLAVEPYTSNAPCCYKLTISDVSNNTSDKSWCTKCDRLNNTFYGDLTYNYDVRYYLSNYYNSDSTEWLFTLCNLDDYITLENSGVYPKSIFSPCYMSTIVGGVYLISTDDKPDIKAWVEIYSEIVKDGVETPVQRWEKTIGSYNGDYYPTTHPSGTQVYPFGVNLRGDMGDYDCTDFSVTFNSANLISPSSYFTGLCDFDDTIIKIENLDSVGVRCNDYLVHDDGDPAAYNLISNRDFLCDRKIFIDYNMGVYDAGYHSNTVEVKINGVISLDDNVNDEDLTIHTCNKCLDTNYALILNNGDVPQLDNGDDILLTDGIEYFETRLDYHSDNAKKVTTDIDSCCWCSDDPKSTCIDDILVYFTSSGNYDSYVYYSINVDFVLPNSVYNLPNYPHDTTKVIARFKKNLGNIFSTDGHYDFNCDGLIIDNLVYDSGVSVSPSSVDWQRCDFSNASVSVEFQSYENLGNKCLVPEPYICPSFNDRNRKRDYIVSIPEGWSWKGYNNCKGCDDFNIIDLSGLASQQPLSGDFIVEHPDTNLPNCIWRYTKQYSCSDYCCTDVDGFGISLEMYIQYYKANTLPYYPTVNSFFIKLSAKYYPTSYISLIVGYGSWHGVVLNYISDPIPEASAPTLRNKYDVIIPWPYFDSSILNGLQLNFVDKSVIGINDRCNYIYYDPVDLWDWDDSPITITEL